MDIFAQKKLLVRIIVILVLLNLVLISIFLWKDLSHNHEPELFPQKNDFCNVSVVLKRELNLTDKQEEQTNKLRKDYFEKEKDLAIIIRAERDSMNVIMFNKNTNEELIKSLAKEIADNEYKMELMRYEQAKELKSICTPEQLEKFEKLVLEIRDYFRPDNQPKNK